MMQAEEEGEKVTGVGMPCVIEVYLEPFEPWVRQETQKHTHLSKVVSGARIEIACARGRLMLSRAASFASSLWSCRAP
jgi:hypothetical protein